MQFTRRFRREHLHPVYFKYQMRLFYFCSTRVRFPSLHWLMSKGLQINIQYYTALQTNIWARFKDVWAALAGGRYGTDLQKTFSHLDQNLLCYITSQTRTQLTCSSLSLACHLRTFSSLQLLQPAANTMHINTPTSNRHPCNLRAVSAENTCILFTLSTRCIYSIFVQPGFDFHLCIDWCERVFKSISNIILLCRPTFEHVSFIECFLNDSLFLTVYIHFFSSYNVRKYVRYPSLISRQPGW